MHIYCDNLDCNKLLCFRVNQSSMWGRTNFNGGNCNLCLECGHKFSFEKTQALLIEDTSWGCEYGYIYKGENND